MHLRTLLILAALLTLAVGCSACSGSAGEPVALPALPEPTRPTPAPALTPARSSPSATRVPAAETLPEATPLPTLAPLPSATPFPEPDPLPLSPEPTRASERLATLALPAAAPVGEPAASPTASPDLSRPLVSIGNTAWTVDLALTVEQRVQGLSGRQELPGGAGMLFIYESEQPLSFWMPDMHFPLDMVWIGADCRVLDVTLNAPPPRPGQTLAELPHFSPSGPAQYVLEINAGEYEAAGINRGATVTFGGTIAGQYGC